MEFINEVLDRGIPEKVFYFYYHGLEIGENKIPKYEANILASDLRVAILEQMPRYGKRENVSAIRMLMQVLKNLGITHVNISKFWIKTINSFTYTY